MKHLSIVRACNFSSAIALALAAAAGASESAPGQSAAPGQQQADQLSFQTHRATQLEDDNKAPRLRSIRVGGKVDVSKSGAQAVVKLVASDNLSGVDRIEVTLRSPFSDQWRTLNWVSPFDTARTELQLGIDMPGTSENGKWYIHSVELKDANGLSAVYDEQALAALGHTTFAVVHGSGDVVLPKGLDGGVNLTPALSRSAPPPGRPRGTPARAGVRLRLGDEGGGGVSQAWLQFCYLGNKEPCFMLEGSNTVRGQGEIALPMGGYVPKSAEVGPYFVTWLRVFDHAGNIADYFAEDLNTLLDRNVIMVSP